MLRCALHILSGRIIFISRLSRSAERSKRYFHGRGRDGKRQLQRRFLRKRGAAGDEPSPSSLRDATSPEGGSLLCLPADGEKLPLSGELANAVSLRGFAPAVDTLCFTR